MPEKLGSRKLKKIFSNYCSIATYQATKSCTNCKKKILLLGLSGPLI
jgi:hypothetical protein